MKVIQFPIARGRVLVVGSRSSTSSAVERLSGSGYHCATAEAPNTLVSVASKLRPDAILFAGGGEASTLNLIRESDVLRGIPVVVDLTAGNVETLRGLSIDEWIRTPEELSDRIDSVVRARRLEERDALSRRRMEALLEVSQAATSSLELEQILQISLDKVGKVITTDRASVVLVDSATSRTARVVASWAIPGFSPIQIDLTKYPEIRRVLQSREKVLVDDAMRDPVMDEVRRHISPLGVKSILVQPLISQDELLGVLYLRLNRQEASFGREDQEFAQAVAGALANSIRNARLLAALKRKREDLESAYVDRYRELTDANKRLKELNRLKDELIAMCSHDLRAPLQVLLGHGRLLIDARLAPQQTASAEAVVRQGKKILSLVESLLERGRGENARVSLEPTRLDVSELCKEGAQDLELLAEQRGIQLRAETPETLMVVGDEVKLREILQNLIANAIQHARAEVRIGSQRLTRPDGAVAKIVVQDDGPGLPENELHVVFDRYRHGPGGIGLGLSICKEFVELHGGEIWAERPAEGGCAFVFTVPMLAAAAEGARPAPPPREGTAVPRILVVEDEPEIGALVSEILHSRYKVELARDGAEGVAKARDLKPDLILMDVFLPKLDGLDAANALKSSSDTADIPVIFLSAHRNVADKLRALSTGAVDFLSKPFQAMELLARTERALALRDTTRELERSKSLLRQTGSDPETGLYDRKGALLRLEQEMARATRYGRSLSLAVLRPEDPLHDNVRKAGALIRRSVRTPDVVAHLGEGTFVIVLPESTIDSLKTIFGRLLPELQAELGVRFRHTVIDAAVENALPEAILDLLLNEREI